MYEAVGTAEWTGTPLRAVLERAGLEPDAVDDRLPRRRPRLRQGLRARLRPQPDARLALSDDVLLVWAMNGAPLLPQHGFPLRLIVPGWYGMASVKWLDRIEVLDRPYEGYQQVGSYIYRAERRRPGRAGHAHAREVADGAARHSRLVHAPADGATPGPVTLLRPRLVGRRRADRRGSSSASTAHWQDATLAPIDGRYAWRGWQRDLERRAAASTRSPAAPPTTTATRSRSKSAGIAAASATTWCTACR